MPSGGWDAHEEAHNSWFMEPELKRKKRELAAAFEDRYVRGEQDAGETAAAGAAAFGEWGVKFDEEHARLSQLHNGRLMRSAEQQTEVML